MRRRNTSRRGRAISILAAGGIGYLIGSWNDAALHRAQLSTPTAAQAVALRFPKDMSELPVERASAVYQRVASAGLVMREAEPTLFEPEPMVPSQPVLQENVQSPANETADLGRPAQTVPMAAAVRETSPQPHQIAARPLPAAPHHVVRARYMLDDAQIASIKRRLHLTPDQEQMWPAVQAALRNIGMERERELRAGGADAVDPDSAEVEDLKSAAIPLLMSFSDEQKDEVRSVARGMGLSQLASEF